MILRTWHGAVPAQWGDAFERHLQATGIQEATATPGNRGAFSRRVRQGGFEHFYLLTYWDGWDAVRAFAGSEPHLAVTYPSDDEYHLISDPIVLHQPVSEVTPWYGEPAAR